MIRSSRSMAARKSSRTARRSGLVSALRQEVRFFERAQSNRSPLNAARLDEGWSGLAVACKAVGLDGLAWSCLERAADSVGRLPLKGLISGRWGPVWARVLVEEGDSVAAGPPTRAKPSSDEIAAAARTVASTVEFDLVRGLSGLLRLATQEGKTALVDATIDALEAQVQPCAGGLAWWTAPQSLPEHVRVRAPEGCVDVGLAHGAAGVLGALVAARPFASDGRKVDRLIEGSTRFLVAMDAYGSNSGLFPSFVARDRPIAHAQPAWCYGALGVGTVLLTTASRLADDSLARAAENILMRAARSSPEHLLDDIGLCHGVAGAALIFRRAYLRNGGEGLARAAAYYAFALRRALERPRSPEEPFGLLSGRVGAILTLLELEGLDLTAWSDVFLVDRPVREMAAPRARYGD